MNDLKFITRKKPCLNDMNNFNDSEIDVNTIDENISEASSTARMNTKKRKRVVNLLVRSVGTPIQHSYVVNIRLIFVYLLYATLLYSHNVHNLWLKLLNMS